MQHVGLFEAFDERIAFGLRNQP